MNVLLVCHAGIGVGLGHLTRILSLANALQKLPEMKLELLVQGQIVKKKELANISTQFISFDTSLNQSIFSIITSKKIRVLILDIQAQKTPPHFILLLQQLCALGLKIVGIDGCAYSSACDMVHIPSFFVAPAKLKLCKCPVIYGWDSYLLPPIAKTTPWKSGNKVLILTGGSDTTGLGKTFPSRIDAKLPPETEVHWVKGPYAAEPIFPAPTRLKWIKHDAPENLSALMQKVNYAVTVYGVSFFELLAHGIPTVVFPPYPNTDKEELAKIKKENISIVVKNESESIISLLELMGDSEKARLLSQQAKSKLSASGAKLLALRIYSIGKS